MTWGVRESGVYMAQQVWQASVGDRLFVYVTKNGLVGYVDIESDVFTSNDRIWNDDIYPVRIRFQVGKVLDSRSVIPFSELKGKIRNGESHSIIADGAHLYGKSMIPISTADAELLFNLVERGLPAPGWEPPEQVPAKPRGGGPILEANLANILEARPDDLEPGLTLVGREFVTDVGRIDLLYTDRQGNLVVVELKRGKPTNSVIDQIARYMGWVKTRYAKEDQVVRGIIVVAKKDLAIEYAAHAIPNLSVREFSLDIK
jgi:hypothetical protein